MAEMSQTEGNPEVSSQANADPRPVYEVSFHVVPAVAEAQIGGVVEKIRAELAKGNAETITEGTPQKMSLAYTIERAEAGKREKFTESYFGFIKFATERENIPQLGEWLRNNKEILRYLIIETVREEAPVRRAIFTSDRLAGETISKPTAAPEKIAEVSEEELEKGIEALTK